MFFLVKPLKRSFHLVGEIVIVKKLFGQFVKIVHKSSGKTEMSWDKLSLFKIIKRIDFNYKLTFNESTEQ